MAMHGIRRLYESHAITKPSASQMFLAHWVFGIMFYLAMGVAIWIEGSGMSLVKCFLDELSTYLFSFQVLDYMAKFLIFILCEAH